MNFFRAIGYFFKRYLFYIVLALCLAGIGLAITFACLNKNNISTPVSKQESVIDTSGEKPIEEDPTEGDNQGEEETPTSTTVVFCLPISNGRVSKDYCMDSLVYSTTLGRYSTHGGIDYTAEEGAEILAVYDGTVESIETGLLEGTVITVNHGNGLKSVYKSVQDDSCVTVGKIVKKGEKIGVISTSCKQECKDGAHVHLEVYENDVMVDPMKYLAVEEK